MSAPSLVEKLRGQACPLSRQFLRALSLCHTVVAQRDKGWLFLCVVVVNCCFILISSLSHTYLDNGFGSVYGSKS